LCRVGHENEYDLVKLTAVVQDGRDVGNRVTMRIVVGMLARMPIL
jgi:hypothetical protein